MSSEPHTTETHEPETRRPRLGHVGLHPRDGLQRGVRPQRPGYQEGGAGNLLALNAGKMPAGGQPPLVQDITGPGAKEVTTVVLAGLHDRDVLYQVR